MSPFRVRFTVLALLAFVPMLVVTSRAWPDGPKALPPLPPAAVGAPAQDAESPDGGKKIQKFKPWKIDGGIDPTNAPLLSGDFLSLSASIAAPDAAMVGADEAHRFATGTGVVVAILDSGFNLRHVALASRWTSARFDAIDGDADPTDLGNGLDDDRDGCVDLGVGHGTFVASLVARAAPGARLMPVRIADDEGNGTEKSFTDGMQYAIRAGAGVINLSFELDNSNPTVTRLLAIAEANGITVICAAGNGSTDRMDVLAASATTLAVGAVDGGDVLASFSNRGGGVDIYAPGVDLLGAFSVPTDTRLAVWSGTSFAAGFVSGAAALVRQRHPAWTPADVRSALRASVDPAHDPAGGLMTAGRVNLVSAALR